MMATSSGSAEPLPALRIGSIVVDCTDLPNMTRFWREALHYVVRDPAQTDGAFLKDPAGRGPNLNLNLTSEGPLEGYRLHLDLYATDPLAEVDRLVRLGAKLQQGPEEGHDFVTLADPDGNLFCVIDVNWPDGSNDWSFGRRA